MTRLFIALAVALLVPSFAFAQATQSDITQPTAGTGAVVDRPDESTMVIGEPSGTAPSATVAPFGLWDLLRMVLVLAAVVGAIYLIFYLLKRAGRAKVGDSRAITVVGSQPLPGNRALYLVKVGSQLFLVGSGGDAVGLISEITDKESVDALLLRAAELGETPRRSFGELIAGMLRGTQGGSLEFIRNQREKLQRLRNS